MTAPALTPEQAALVRASTVVDRAVRTVGRRNILPPDELKSVAHVALCTAAQRFDPARQIPFDGFAWVIVLRELGNAHRAELRHARGRVPGEAGERSAKDVEAAIDLRNDDAALHTALRGVLEGLPPYERRLLELRYFEEWDFVPIARELGVSLATVRRHHVRALGMVGKRMRGMKPARES